LFEERIINIQYEFELKLKEQSKAFEEREDEYKRRLLIKENPSPSIFEEKHDKPSFQHPSSDILDKLSEVAPGRIYGRKTDRLSSPVEVLNFSKRIRPATKENTNFDVDHGVSVRVPTYDGKSEWKPYQLQFEQRIDIGGLMNKKKTSSLRYYETRPLHFSVPVLSLFRVTLNYSVSK